MTIITTLVASSEAVLSSVDIRDLKGGDSMNCIQNKMPEVNMDPCSSQMWMAWFRSPTSNSAGMCQNTITKLKKANAKSGRVTKSKTARNGRDHAPVATPLVTA